MGSSLNMLGSLFLVGFASVVVVGAVGGGGAMSII